MQFMYHWFFEVKMVFHGGEGLVWLPVQSYECLSSKQPPPSPCAPEALLCIRSVLSPTFLKKGCSKVEIEQAESSLPRPQGHF